MKKGIVAILICILLIVSSLVIVYPIKALKVNSDTLYVGGDGPGNYTRIQDAIDNASDDDNVFVYNGTYYENVEIWKSITLVGEDRNSTIIDGQNKGSVINIFNEWVTIENFTIRNGIIGVRGGFWRLTISRNIIVNNDKGIELCDSENNKIIGNLIKENNYGIDFQHVENSVIGDNYILLNKKIGILFQMRAYIGCENNSVYFNTIKQNTMGISLEWSSLNEINFNNFYQNIVDARFRMSSWTNWNHNYWGRTRIFPKPILGFWLFSFVMFNFDWHPAKEPYDIT